MSIYGLALDERVLSHLFRINHVKQHARVHNFRLSFNHGYVMCARSDRRKIQ